MGIYLEINPADLETYHKAVVQRATALFLIYLTINIQFL